MEVAIVPHFPAVVRQLRYDLRKLKGHALWNAILTEVIAQERLPSLAGRPRQSPEDSRDIHDKGLSRKKHFSLHSTKGF